MERKILPVLCVRGVRRPYFPPQIPRRLLGKRAPYNRIGEIIDILAAESEGNEVKAGYKPHEEIMRIPDLIYRYWGEHDAFFCKKPFDSAEIFYHIHPVETDRPWTIRMGNGGEFVHYFKEDEHFEIKDRAINYGEYIGEPPKIEEP